MKKKKYRIRKDDKGEYIYRQHFFHGKQKLTRVYLINGIPSDEIEHRQIYLDNADMITLLQDGEHDEIYRLESKSNVENDIDNDEIPF